MSYSQDSDIDLEDDDFYDAIEAYVFSKHIGETVLDGADRIIRRGGKSSKENPRKIVNDDEKEYEYEEFHYEVLEKGGIGI